MHRLFLTTKEIPASVGAKLLDINRTSVYYKSLPVSYLTQYSNIKEAKATIARYIHTYNFERCQIVSHIMVQCNYKAVF